MKRAEGQRQSSLSSFFINSSPVKRKNDTEEKKENKKPKFDRDFNRKVKSVWFQEFDWLKLDSEREVFLCKNCIQAKKDNIFTIGKCAKKPKKDDFVKHEKSLDHRMSHNKQLQTEMVKATSNAHKSARSAIVAQMATVLTQAKEGIPTRKNSQLLELQMFNVSNSYFQTFSIIMTNSSYSSSPQLHFWP